MLCAYFTDKEPEAREMGRGGIFPKSHSPSGWTGLGLVHWAQVPKLNVPTPTSLPPLDAKGD